MAHFQASRIERVRDGSGSDGDRVDVVDCGLFPTGELDLNCEAEHCSLIVMVRYEYAYHLAQF